MHHEKNEIYDLDSSDCNRANIDTFSGILDKNYGGYNVAVHEDLQENMEVSTFHWVCE